ncbi:hypothetical protein L2E82_47027 [Cichorium intybus]|uniref:Uncharacterized protein n=1 Tax=Cichorium intybus TaxID=13427 RepID=A0ACB8YVT8_CICIN|nr:hypothetical protein L2E82_47027 [Cichorium intybus]
MTMQWRTEVPPINLLRCRSSNDGHRDINQRRIQHFQELMAEPGKSMLYSLLLFVVTLLLQEMYRGKLASSELFTILGGFTSSLVFLFLLTFLGNYQETSGVKTGWGTVILAEVVALVAAGTVHRVCITTCFLFSAAILYEVNQISGVMVSKTESKGRRH